jgi:DNA (cytosine-5)-methyltransferase 1
VGRVADGVPRRVDRLRQLGNAVVPQIVTAIGHAILELDGEKEHENEVSSSRTRK